MDAALYLMYIFKYAESFMILERCGRDTNRGLEPYVFVCESSTVIANTEQWRVQVGAQNDTYQVELLTSHPSRIATS